MTTTSMSLSASEQSFLDEIKSAFEASNKEFARSYYLFATARLEKEYNSSAIYDRYPVLQDENTFRQLKNLYDRHPENEEIKRLFVDAFGTYIANHFSQESDELTNLKNNLKIDVTGIGLTDVEGNELSSVLFEETPELFKRTADSEKRYELYLRINKAYSETVTPKFISLFHRENKLMAELGYPDVIAFYAQSSGHDLFQLGDKAHWLVENTNEYYLPLIKALFEKRVGKPFDTAKQSDIAYVFHGKSEEMTHIDADFPESRMVGLAQATFDGMGLAFSNIAEIIDFSSKDEYLETIDHPERLSRILLDVAKRDGKRSRAYVYPAAAPGEIYLSVKPEGGLYDYSAFFHESGHAQHFAYVHPSLSYPLALMGNNSVTEAYAYLFQNLFLNHHWLVQAAGLSPADASLVIQRGALNDLFMLRRYSSKMQFELQLYRDNEIDDKPKRYAELLTLGTGFRYSPEAWSRDVDAGFMSQTILPPGR